MILSNKTKGATNYLREHHSLLVVDDCTPTIKLYQIIGEIVEHTHLNQTDVISAISVLSDIVKEHLGKGHNISLGELGIFSLKEAAANNKEHQETTTICYSPSRSMDREINEKVQLKKQSKRIYNKPMA